MSASSSEPAAVEAAAPPVAPPVPTPLARTAAEAVRLTFLDPHTLRFFRAGTTLRLEVADSQTWLKVAVLRAFPLSFPTGHLSVRDGGGTEIGMLRSLDGLDDESRREVSADVARRYMTAIICRVLAVSEKFGSVDWKVETNRGPGQFTTRDLRESAVRLGPSHYLLTDVENNRFEIPDLDALDARSRSLLLRHL